MSDKPLHLLLGFDYGSKQIGVAVGQVITGHAASCACSRRRTACRTGAASKH